MESDQSVGRADCSESSEEGEPVARKLTRLNETLARALLDAKQAEITLENKPKLHISPTPVISRTSPREKWQNLRFPSPVYMASSGSSSSPGSPKVTFTSPRHPRLQQLQLLSERLQMKLEDLCSAEAARLCAVVRARQTVGLEEEDIREVEGKLKRLRKEGFAEVRLGTVLIHAYLKSHSNTNSPIPLHSDSPHSSDQIPTLPTFFPEASSEELSSLRRELDEESTRLQLIERFLAEKERTLQVEISTLKRMQREFEERKKENEERVKQRYWQLLEWHKLLETVVIQHASSDLQFPLPQKTAKSEKRQQLEAELERIRLEVETLDSQETGLEELLQAFQQAEAAYYQCLDGSDLHKVAVRLEIVKNKLLSHRVSRTLVQSERKNASILSSISLLSETNPCPGARKTILRAVLQRSATRPSSPVRRSGWISPQNREITACEEVERSGEVTEDFGKCMKTVIDMEKNGEQLKELISAMQDQIKTYKQQEEQETETRLRLKAREHRLSQLERDFKARLSALKSRELSLAQREDELRVIFSQRMTMSETEVTRLVGKSAERVQEQLHALEEKTRELVRLNGDLSQEQSFLQDIKRTAERKLTLLTQSQGLLASEKSRLEALAKALNRHFLRLLELSQ